MPHLLRILLSLAVAAGCGEPDNAPGAAAQLAVTPDYLTLTYVCGHTFRARNPNAAPVAVTWEVDQTNETGTLTLPRKPANARYSETYFTTRTKGTVHLYAGGRLIQTRANGNKPPCAVGSRPPIPDQPHYPDDSLYVVTNPGHPTASYYRRLAWIEFAPSATDAEVVGFFPRFSAEIVGGVPVSGMYYVRFPDPGPSWAQVDSVVQLMSEAPGVVVATAIARVLPKAPLNGRYPADSTR